MSSTGNNFKRGISKKARENFAQLAKRNLDAEGLKRLSPIPIPEDEVEMAIALLGVTHRPDDYLPIISSSFQDAKTGKPCPLQPGEIKTAEEWISYIKKAGQVPQCCDGAWFLPNAVNPKLIGKGISDKDIRKYSYCLCEWDDFPVDQQIVVAASLAIPIAAITTSGNKSVHVLVKVDAQTFIDYTLIVHRLFGYLKHFAVDVSTKNCSRFSRLPGAYRQVGPDDFQLQELLYLNPNPEPKPILGEL